MKWKRRAGLALAIAPIALAMMSPGAVAAVADSGSAARFSEPAVVSKPGNLQALLANKNVRAVRMVRGMRIVGFDASVAKMHGYIIRKNAAGLEFSVKTGAAVSPADDPIVYGSCGDSYIYYTARGERSQSPKYQATYDTGYNVVDYAYDGYWSASFVDDDGVGTLTWKYAANGTYAWSTAGYTFHGPDGYSWAEVNTSSYVILDDGAECYSEGPWDSTVLY